MPILELSVNPSPSARMNVSTGRLHRWAFIWPIMMPARRYLLLNAARAQIGPDKREKTGQTA
jgi:hypothetical protein